MQPTNNKALYHTLGGLVDKLLNNEVTETELPNIDRALKASQQMISLCANEINRTKMMKEIAEFNNDKSTKIEIRQIEGKGFDDTTR